ncbi:O-linked GlcNAc transferase [Solibacillus sp. CAU 1738]|uniref:O-linked GlcNAc transferase n=1 Tax=Solibacillus sp. CAU 1738 TaxID=3140363 RepID=UPI0032614538
MNIEQLFYDGQIHACYKEAIDNTEDVFAHQVIELYARFNLASIPHFTVPEQPSIERENETYVEQDVVKEIREIADEGEFNECIKHLEMTAKFGSVEEKAQSFFTQAQLFLFAHQYDESVHCFIQAAKCNPNQALFYGMAAQTMQRFDYSPFEILGYLERAIELDVENARWYWNKALVLTELYKDLQQEPFLGQALITLEQAIACCRPEQKSLKIAIENTLENMREYLFQ